MDVWLLFALFPLWWVLGLEQFIWAGGLVVAALKTLVVQRFRFRMSRSVRLLGIFLVVHAVSGLFIVEPERWITFVRNMGAYVAAFAIAFVVTNNVRTWSDVRRLRLVLLWPLAISAIVGLAGLTGLWRPQFRSMLGYVLPSWAANSMYGSTIAERATGHLSWFGGLQYFRLRGMFVFSTAYASALALGLPLAAAAATQARGMGRKLLGGVVIMLIIVNLAGTTGRIAIIACGFGALYWLFFRMRLSYATRALVLCACLGTAGGLLLTSAADDIDTGQAYSSVVLARGRGSYEHRMEVYRETLKGIAQRPAFGWGTERDIPGSPYPAGSHSYYLGVAYKHGIVGLVTFLALWMALWRDTRPLRMLAGTDRQAREGVAFLRFGRWLLVAALLNGLTDVLDLDATTLVILWGGLSLLLSTRELLVMNGENRERTTY